MKTTRKLTALALLVLLSTPHALLATGHPQGAALGQARQNLPATSSGPPSVANPPITFEAVSGPPDAATAFAAHGRNAALWLQPGEAVLSWRNIAGASRGPSEGNLRFHLVGANAGARTEAIGPLPARRSDFSERETSRQTADVPRFSKVKYLDVCPGVDLVFYGNGPELEFDLIVGAGADPKALRLKYSGADNLALDSRGDLRLSVGRAVVSQQRPVIYQEFNGIRVPVAGEYVLRSTDEVGFRIGDYDRTRPLVIDPVLSLAQSFGGNGLDQALATALDSQGNIYVAGTTTSTDFPIVGGVQTNLAGFQDGFVAKFSTNGTLLYSTYLGGSGNDVATGIAVDTNGNIYVAGYTQSTNFPTANALQSTNGGGFYDVFVAKLNPAGNTLLYSTYLGGKDYDTAGGIAVDSLGNAFVTGYTQSTNFPTANAFQPVFGGIGDAFVCKLNTNGSALVYSTYLGGSGQENRNNSDLGGAVAVDLAGNAYVTGWTYSTNFPVLNAFQSTKASVSSSQAEAFVTKLNPVGAPVYSTYLGGYYTDRGRAIAVDGRGDAFVTGTSTSDYQFPTKNPWQATVAGAGSANIGDMFIAALDATGTNLIYSTFVGGTGDDQANGIAVDADGNAAVAGFTDSADFPLTNPTQPAGNQTVFRSADGGNSWGASHNGLVGNGILVMQIDPINPNVIYVVTKQGSGSSGGLFKSLDGGANWSESDNGMDYRSTELTSVALMPSQPATLYASSWAAGVFKSTDGGANWTNLSAGLPDPYGYGLIDVEAVAVDPTSPNTVYAGTYSTRVYKSVNGGTDWFPATNGMVGLSPRVFLIDPRTNTTLYAGCSDSSGIQLYKSVNGGTNWTRLAGGLNAGPVTALAFNPTNQDVLYALVGPTYGNNLMRSTNGGVNWSALFQSSGFPFTTLAVDPISPSTIYLGSDGSTAPGAGVFKSTDGGTNWLDVGLNSDKVTALVVSPANCSNVLAGVDGGRDAFLVEISSIGVPTFATYLGGTGGDEARAIAGIGGAAILAGLSASADYPNADPSQSVSAAQVAAVVSSTITLVKNDSDCPFPLRVTIVDLDRGTTNAPVFENDGFLIIFEAVDRNGVAHPVDSVTTESNELREDAAINGNQIEGISYSSLSRSGTVTVTYRGCVVTQVVNMEVTFGSGDGKPQITDVNPAQGAPGDTVEVKGANLQTAQWAQINGTWCDFRPIDPGLCLVKIPLGAATGPVSITTPQGTAMSPSNFVVNPDCFGMVWYSARDGLASLSRVKTYNAEVGGHLSLHFLKAAVFTVGAVDSISVQGTVPPGLFINGTALTGVPTQAGIYTFTVTGQSGSNCSSSATFTITVAPSFPPPTFVSFSPQGGTAGDTVLINGTGFDSAKACRFNGTPATCFQILDSTKLMAQVPFHATTGQITVQTLYGSCLSSNPFVVIQDCFHLGWRTTIDGHAILPSEASEIFLQVGDNFSISFTDDNGNPIDSISIGGGLPPGLSVSGTQIAGTLSQVGTYSFTVTGVRGNGCLASVAMKILVIPTLSPPTIASIDPCDGYYGDCVTLRGSGFNAGLAFYLNNTLCTDVKILNSQLCVIGVPFLAKSGPVRIDNVYGTGTSLQTFTVKSPLLNAILSGGNLQFMWRTSNPPYRLQFTPSLAAPAWGNVTSPPAVLGRYYNLNLKPGGDSGFYRVIAP